MFTIPDALFVMYPYEFKTIADSKTYACFWDSVLNDLSKKSKEPFYNRVSSFSRDVYHKRSSLCRKSEEKIMINALNYKEETEYCKQQQEKLMRHISDGLDAIHMSLQWKKRFDFLDINSDKDSEINAPTKKPWKEFTETDLLLFVNSILHVFDWVIEVSPDPKNPDGDYKASINHTECRGFSEASDRKRYQNMSKYLKNIIDDFVKEEDEDED